MNIQRLAVLYSNSYKILTQIRKEKNRMEWNGMEWLYVLAIHFFRGAAGIKVSSIEI